VKRISGAGVGRAAVIFGALVALPFLLTTPWIVNAGIFAVMYAAIATAWNLLGGYSGYLSLGHAAFFGVGAYAIGVLFTHVGIGAGYTPFLVLPLVGIAVAVVSLPIAWVALRVRAATFAIVTITLLFAVQQLAFNLHSITNGSQGISVPEPLFPVATYERPFYLAMVAVLALAVLTCWWVMGSKLGLMLFAIRDDEDRARGVGIQTTSVKIVAFAASVGLTAMAGGAWAYYISFIYPQFAVDPLVTIGAVLMTFLGGRGTLWGPTLGAFILVPAQQYLAYELGASQLYLVSYAAVFLVIILILPRGILPSIADWRSGRRARRPTGMADGALPGSEVAA
jgi:branched-chain amino acid transport system permease protein